ncbi:MAG: hypothetical protein AABZ16_15145, partial [candidate division NC10 bacterium]
QEMEDTHDSYRGSRPDLRGLTLYFGNQYWYWQGRTLLPAGLMAALSLLALILFVVLRRRTAGCTSYGAAKGS